MTAPTHGVHSGTEEGPRSRSFGASPCSPSTSHATAMLDKIDAPPPQMVTCDYCAKMIDKRELKHHQVGVRPRRVHSPARRSAQARPMRARGQARSEGGGERARGVHASGGGGAEADARAPIWVHTHTRTHDRRTGLRLPAVRAEDHAVPKRLRSKHRGTFHGTGSLALCIGDCRDARTNACFPSRRRAISTSTSKANVLWSWCPATFNLLVRMLRKDCHCQRVFPERSSPYPLRSHSLESSLDLVPPVMALLCRILLLHRLSASSCPPSSQGAQL